MATLPTSGDRDGCRRQLEGTLHWLVCWLVGLLVGWLVGWFVGWLVGLLVGQLTGGVDSGAVACGPQDMCTGKIEGSICGQTCLLKKNIY